jgi:hypothetical protein
MDAIFALIGGLVGAAVFAHLHDLLIPLLYDPTNLGPLTINSLVGNSFLALLLLVVCLGVMIWIIDHVWGRYSNG